jgi:cache 3/cache 2 fusion protein
MHSQTLMHQSMAFLVGGALDHRVEQGGHPKPAAETMGTGVRSDASSSIRARVPRLEHWHEAARSIRLLPMKSKVVGWLVVAVAFLAAPVLMLSDGIAQDARVAKSMAALKDQTSKLGAPKIGGKDAVGGRDAPALYFGSTKMNNNFSVVDAVAEEGGRGMAVTLFVKSGDDYIRVATNVSTRVAGGRGLGTILTGPALELIKAGNAYYGKALVLGTSHIGGYEPIKDASGAIIGLYFVGFKN